MPDALMNDFQFVESISPEMQQWIAAAGPGYQGERRTLSPNQADLVRRAYTAAKRPLPAFLTDSTRWVDRKAKLFEAGEYADKGVSITESDLDAIVARFNLPVTVLIEHAENPLEIGYVTMIWREGNSLMGKVALTFEADALIRRSKATSLSVGLSEDLNELQEVSLVRSPRVVDARLFRAAGCELQETVDEPPRASPKVGAASIERWLKEGRILPSQVVPLKAILAVSAHPTFAESSSLLENLEAFLHALPTHRLFTELAREPQEDSSALFLPEERAFYARYFPGVSLDEIAHRKGRPVVS